MSDDKVQQEKLRKILIRAREFCRLNKTELAAKVGIGIAYISEIERGNKTITLNTLNAYSRVSGVPVATLLLCADCSTDSTEEVNRKGVIYDKFLEFNNWADAADKEKGAKV